MKMIIKCVLGFCFTIAVANASNSDYGNISILNFTNNGAVIFYHDGARTGTVPSCASNFSTRWVIDANTAGGKAQVAGILMAYAQRKQILIVGTSNCAPVWNDTEGIVWFVVKD